MEDYRVVVCDLSNVTVTSTLSNFEGHLAV